MYSQVFANRRVLPVCYVIKCKRDTWTIGAQWYAKTAYVSSWHRFLLEYILVIKKVMRRITLFFFDIALGVYASTAFQYSPSNCELLWSYFSVMASLKGKQRWRPNLSTKNLPKFLRLNIKTHPQEESPVCTGSKITKRFFCRKYEKMFLFAYFTWITKTNDDIMTGSVATEHASISFSELNINGYQTRCQ